MSDKYARYDRSEKGRARKRRYRSSGRENTLRWMRRLKVQIAGKEARIASLTEELGRG